MSPRTFLLFLSPRVRRVFGLPIGPLTDDEAMYRIAGRRGYTPQPPLPTERALLRGRRSR